MRFLYFLFILSFTSFLNAEPKKIVGYYPNWAIYRTPAFKPEQIDTSKLTHINYAFVNVDIAGNLVLFDPWADVGYRSDWIAQKPYWGNFEQLTELKRKNPHLKTLFSVGGWTLSTTFSQMADNPEARQNFVRQCIAFCNQYGFDGVDIDWEYPCYEEHKGRAQDKTNFTLLLKELHEAAKAHSPKLLITIAAPAGPHHYKNIEVAKIHPYLDWINLMCYDFAGASWSDITTHHAPLYGGADNSLNNCHAAIQYYIREGVAADKIVLGIPFYGRSFANSSGLYSKHSGHGVATTQEEGMVFFYDIKKNLLPYYKRHWDDMAKAPYLLNKNGTFITYEDEESITYKCNYIVEQHLGGAMVWELGLDVHPTFDLTSLIHRNLSFEK